MALAKYFSPELIILHQTPDDKASLINIMVDCIMQSEAVRNTRLSRQRIHQAILDREAMSSTGIGGGYAFPHARLPELDELGACLAVMDNTVEYDSCDNIPVSVACLVLAPENNPALALKIMSQLVRIFSDPEAAQMLRQASDPMQIYQLLENSDADMASPILARDIMRPPLLTVRPNESLKELTRMMSAKNINVVPVIDDEDKIVGEISCDRLFKLGIPDFFSSLKSVRFICEFDPFEKYFHEETEASAGDVMGKNFCVMVPTATILEIVFALSVKHFPKIYIVDSNEKLAGIIDQSTVLEKIINL